MDIFTGPTRQFAQRYARCGGKVHLYSFFWRKDKHVIGAGHITELALLFGGKGVEGTLMAQGLSGRDFLEHGKPLRRIWTDFAKCGQLSTAKACPEGWRMLDRVLQNAGVASLGQTGGGECGECSINRNVVWRCGKPSPPAPSLLGRQLFPWDACLKAPAVCC